MLNAKLYQITRTRTDIESKEQFSKMLLYTTSDEGFPAVYINGGNIAANSIYGKSIQANTIDAEHLQAKIISSDHISAAGITADNIKGSTLKSIKELSEGGSFIDLDSGNFNFAGGNLTWDNTNKRFYINASHIQIGNKDVLNTGSDLAQQINNGPTRIEGNALHFTNDVLIDNGFIDKLNANQAFIQTLDAIEIDASQITSGSINADIIEVYNLNASNLKAGTLDGDLITVRNLSADAITTGTLDMDKFNVINLSADYIKGGNLDISGGVRITSGNHLIMEVDPEALTLEFNVNKMTIGGVKLISEDDQPQMEENIANELENKIKPYFHIAYANDEFGNGFSFNSYGKTFLGTYSDYTKEPSTNPTAYTWGRFKGDTGDSPIVAYLSNDSHLIPTDAYGLNANFENAYTEMRIMDGIKDDTDNYTFSAEESSGITGKIEGNKYTVTSLSGDLAEVKITATKGSFTINKVFTVTKSKQGFKGQDGQDSLIHQLETDSLVLTRDVDDVLNPRSVNIQATSMKGNEPKKPFAGYFRVYEQHTATLIPDDFARLALEEGVTEEEYILSLYDEPRVIQYESIFKESTLKYEPRVDAISVYIQLYADNSFSEVLDSQTVMIVSHGKDGEQGPRGLQGLQGPQGKQGVEGAKGEDGKSSYTHIAYATGDQGQSFNHDTFPQATHIGMYVSDNQNSSDNWRDYKWTLIKGADGARGLEGPKGEDGRTPYFHTAWANSADGSSGFSTTVSAGKLYLGTVTTFEPDDPTDYKAYSWTLIKGEKGDTGEQGPRGLTGAQGPQGDQGIEGPKGADGKSSYTHIAYADTMTGTGFSHSDASKPFIGIYTDNNPTSSGVASKYTWSKWKGEDGADGVQGPKGTDGLPSYTHFAYANNATGTSGFSTTDSLNKSYLGIYTDNTKADSEDPAKYTWTLIKGATGARGPQGVQGLQGPQGDQGIKGNTGSDGKSSYTHIAYATGNQGQSFSHSTFEQATHVGMYVSDNQNSSDNWRDYEWTLIRGRDGSQGVRGPQGADGKTPYFHIAYANNSTGTSGFSINDSTNKLYIGTYTDFEPDDSLDPSKYSWTLVKGEKGETGSRGPQGVEGPKGDDGVTTYTWIRYADTPTSGMSNSPVGKTYIGFAYNKTTATESNKYSDYTWSKFVGDDGEKGVPGDKGADGKTTYTWIRYSANATGVGMVPTPTTNTKYIGIAVNKTSQTPSTIPTDYTWSKYIGEDGQKGSDAIVAVLTNESHVIPTDEDGLNGNYRGATTEIKILEGATDVTSTFTITASASSGVTGSLSSNKYTVTNLTVDTGEVTLTAKKGSTTISKVFTVTKSKKGISGANGVKGEDSVLYQLNTDTLVVIKDIDDVYSQDSVSLTSVMKVGSEDYKNNPVYFRVYEQKINPLTVDTFSELSVKDQVDNREYVLSLYGKPRLLQYESFIKESHIDYKLGTDIMSVYVEIYEDANFTKIIDSQSIAVIAEPKPNYKLEMHSTNGNGFLNGVINTEMYITLYRGEEDITDSTDAKHFIWTRVSSDKNSDTAWNNRYKAGAKRITVTKDDVNVRARFLCNFVK